MNIILFEAYEIGLPLARSDRRAVHLLEVLRRRPGDTFDAGVIDGPRGKGRLLEVSDEELALSFAWDDEPAPAPEPISLILGLPRPQTARKVLHEATALGVASIHFVDTEKGEANYGRSVLWSSGEWRRHVVAGAEQAFTTRLPQVSFGRALAEVVGSLGEGACRIALHNYDACRRLSEVAVVSPVVLAVGPERGWSESERALLTEARFTFAHLGPRVLRVETACVAALAVVRANLGLL